MIVFIITTVIIFLIIIYSYFWRGLDLIDIYSNKPIVLGHRGDRFNYPENTLTSYRSAINKGLDGVELDVLLTKDDKLVCSHNFDLERETTGNGFIDERDYSELVKIKAGNHFSEPKRQPIPLLTDVIKSLPKTTILNIEIKTKSTFDIKAAIKVARLIKDGAISQKVIVSSFNPIAVRAIKCVSKSISTGFIYYQAENFKGVFIARPDCLHPNAKFVTDKLIQFCKKRNMRINTWTVNNANAHDWLNRKNIDGIITDNPTLVKNN